MVKKAIERKLVSQHVKDRLPSSFVFFWLQPLHDGNGPKHGPMALSHPHQPCLIFNEFNSIFSDCYFMLVTLCDTIWLAVSVNSSCAALAAV